MTVSAESPPGTSTKFGRFEIRKMRLEVNLAQVRETKLKRRYSYKYPSPVVVSQQSPGSLWPEGHT